VPVAIKNFFFRKRIFMSEGWVRRRFFSGLLAVLLLSQCGCFYLVIGGVGALGGYAISPDTVEGTMTGRNIQDLWASAVDVISIMGIIDEKNENAGVIIARVQGTHVTITLLEPVSDTVKLRVKARKGMVPRIKLAQDIYAKIIQKANPS